jgi:hypothetical protein
MRLVRSTLVVAPHLGALTTFASALTELTARRGKVHIAVLGEAPPGIDTSAFSGEFRRLTFGYLPPLDRWSSLSATVRAVLDCWRWLEPGTTDEATFMRAVDQAPTLAARIARRRWLRAPAAGLLRAIERALPAPPPIVEFLKARQPGLMIVAPMFGIGSIAADYLRAANELEIPTVALPTRWDDLTNGALPHVAPDCIALWNREHRRQAVEILRVPARRTAIIGACLPLDGAGAITSSREAFCARHGLDSARAVVLIAVGESESTRAELVRRCVDRLRASSNSRVRDAAILVHWPPPPGVQQQDRPQVAGVVVPRVESAPTQYAFDIAEALQHSDLVIASHMSLVLEAAARARPLVALLGSGDADEELARFCKDVGAARGWPRIAKDPGELDATVAAALEQGLDRNEQAAARTIVRLHGPDLSPGFLMWVRLFAEVVDRRAEPRVVPSWVPWLRRVLAPVASMTARRVARLPVHREQRDFSRILVGAPSASSLFLHQPVLRALAERGHHLAIVFTSRRDQTEDAYSRIKCDIPNVVPAGLLPPPDGMWASISQALLGLSSYLSLFEARRTDQVPAWLVRIALTFVPAGARPIARLARQFRGLPRRLRRLASRFDCAIPPSVRARDLLEQRAPDALLMLPDRDVLTAFESGAAQADLIRAAASLGIPAASVAAGADALLHASLLQPRQPLVFVRDEDERTSVARDLGMRADAVVIAGATHLDRCLHEPPLMSGEDFRAELGLPAGKAFAFFAGSVGVLSDSKREVDLVRKWIASLRKSDDLMLRDLPVLIRRPVNSPRWQTLDFSGLGPVVLTPRRYERSGELDMVLLAESVRYAAITVGMDALTLTMAAALGRPAVAISRADAAALRSEDALLEFLWKAPDSSVAYAASLDDLNRQVRRCLDSSAEAGHDRTDGPAEAEHDDTDGPAEAGHYVGTAVVSGFSRTIQRPSMIVADAVERLARQSQRRARSKTTAGARAMRVPLLLTAGAVNLTGRLLTLGRR